MILPAALTIARKTILILEINEQYTHYPLEKKKLLIDYISMDNLLPPNQNNVENTHFPWSSLTIF